MERNKTAGSADQPVVSIVTPSFNQGRFIEETIQSVLNQKYPSIEYIIMDGGSSDHTVDILNKHGGNLFWKSEPDKGQSDAINRGFLLSRGDILGWLNSDDSYEPGAVERVVDYLNANKDVMMVYGEGNHISAEGRFIERYPTEPFRYDRLFETCFICQPTVFLRRRVLEEVGLLNVNLQYCMDYEYWIRVGRKFKIGHLSEHLANTRLHNDAKTLSKRVEVHAEILRMLKEQYGRVASSWISGYANACLLRKIQRKTKVHRALYRFCFVMVSLSKCLQYNRRISWADLNRAMDGSGMVLRWRFRLYKLKRMIFS